MMDFEYQNGLKYLQSPFACIEDDQQKFQVTSTFGMIKHGFRKLKKYSWKLKFRIIYNKKFGFSFRFHSTKFLFYVASDIICWNRCGMVGNFQNVHNCPSKPSSPRQNT
jgi:hypothetical protein